MTPVLALALAVAAPALVPPAAAAEFILLQSTTSAQNSGLLDHILPKFADRTGIEVRVVAVGTGQAIRNARNCDGDVLLVHARAQEEALVADGFAARRHEAMRNDFVVIGPDADPAGVRGMTDAAAAFARIAAAGAPFVSRGDGSGTHAAELDLWRKAGVDARAASGGWYRETGSGMGATLNVAIGMGAYALVDRATWSAFGNKAGAGVVVEGDPALANPYAVLLISPEKCPNAKAAAGRAFVDWLTGPEGQDAIASFTVGGVRQFLPAAGPARPGG